MKKTFVLVRATSTGNTILHHTVTIYCKTLFNLPKMSSRKFSRLADHRIGEAMAKEVQRGQKFTATARDKASIRHLANNSSFTKCLSAPYDTSAGKVKVI
ncbi:hypothetical protein AC578_2428 [Pseudocercospora eumusae]|uniref:Uncharacterized protein n=1 Tax=Pseudocercospora eumusae TaxID=321146 RepID=A0A139HX64_9PEZI|nr:hypothetical protein AC578_2428 [Pseudocercospora eumusae]